MTNSVQVHLHEVPRIVKTIEKERKMVVAGGWGGRGMGSYCLTGVEFQFYKIKELWRWMVVTVVHEYISDH